MASGGCCRWGPTLDEADQVCPECGGKLYAKGDTCERSERITVTERVYTVVTDEKQVYGCGGCGHSEAALPPPQLVPGGRYDSSVAISVAVDKFVDHQPLNRQVKTMRRAGLRVTRQSLWDYLLALEVMCEPSFEAHHQWMLSQHTMLHADETSWRMMLKGGSTVAVGHRGARWLPLPGAADPWREGSAAAIARLRRRADDRRLLGLQGAGERGGPGGL